MSGRPSKRGFTLVELLVALVVSTVVIAGALSLLVSQQRMFRLTSSDRAMQETGRVALDDLTSHLRLAGFGIDPSFAFDFGPMPAAIQDRAPGGTVVTAASTFPSCTSVDCRDSVTGPDEIVFRYRNPYFVRSLAEAPTGGASLTIAGPLTSPLYQGQVLLAICFGGSMRWSYVTVGSTVAVTDADTVTVPLAAGVADQFPFQNAYLADSCYGAVAPRGAAAADFASAAKVYKVDQFRYYVATFDADGTIVPPGTAGARPYLMLDQGLVDGGAPVRSPVAPDVEDLQVAYLYPASASGRLLVGATPGTVLTVDDVDVDPDVGLPRYADATNAVTRTSQFPGNMRGVAVAVVTRSPDADLAVRDAEVPAALNRPAVAGPAGYRRQLFQTTAAVRNLDARGPYFPTYSVNSGADHMNVGGG